LIEQLGKDDQDKKWKEFLKDYTEILLADAYGGYNGVVAGNAITRAGCWSSQKIAD